MEIVERMRNAVAAMVVVEAQKQIGVSISVGLTTRTREEGIHAMLKDADIAMYQAKSNGRNRTVCAPSGSRVSEPSSLSAVTA
jgi:diguanylate cyclase (GGDEF)-like protein